MGNATTPKGLVRHTERAPLWNRKQKFGWGHGLPGIGNGGIQYIPSLDVMTNTTVKGGTVQFRDPITAEVLYEFYVTYQDTSGIVNCVNVPSANVLAIPIHENGGGTQTVVLDLKTGEATYISSIGTALYQGAYCPVNDIVYVQAYNTNVAYRIDPWTKTSLGSISGYGGLTIGIAYCPVNGKLYSASRTATNIYRTDPTTNAIDSTFTSGGAYDMIFWSDGMKKFVIGGLASSIVWKTIDPLNSDAVASLGISSGFGLGGIYIPKLGETVLVSGGGIMTYIDQTGAQVGSPVTISSTMHYVGWNPVTETLWATNSDTRNLFILEPTVSKTKAQIHAIERLN